MKYTFKQGQRVKRGILRGTIVEVLSATLKYKTAYVVRMDNGAMCYGTKHQFMPVRRAL